MTPGPPGDAAAGEVSALIRLRVGPEDAHYGGGLVAGAFLLRVFGDLVTEITIRTDGDEGLLAEYSGVRFLAPVRPGDYIEARARLVRRKRLQRIVECEARTVIAAGGTDRPSAAQVLDPPVMACQATATTVVPFSVAAAHSRLRRVEDAV